MVRGILFLIALPLIMVNSVFCFFAFMFRFDSWDEYIYALQADAVLGLMFAFGFVCIVAPLQLRAPAKRWLLTTAGALLIWVCVSGSLMLHHWRVHEIRSRPAFQHPVQNL